MNVVQIFYFEYGNKLVFIDVLVIMTSKHNEQKAKLKNSNNWFWASLMTVTKLNKH